MKYRLFLILTLYISSISGAEDDGKNEFIETIHVFDAPKVLKPVQPKYPRLSSEDRKEGYVVFNFMVSEKGDIYETTVVESIGPSAMEEAALSALKKIEWEPAKLDGIPVEGSGFYKFTFQISGGTGARPSFVSKYKDFNEYFTNKEYDQSTGVLEDLRTLKDLNFYELAYLNVASYKVAKVRGDTDAQLASLKSELMYQYRGKQFSYLPEEVLEPLRYERFKLEVDSHHYAEALETYDLIKEYGDTDLKTALEPTVEAILDLKLNDKAYAVSGKLDNAGLWFIGLFKQAFYVDQVQGQIDEIKLRCQTKYVFFRHSEDAQYNIPASWGKCDAEILGAAGSTFRLVQLNSSI